MELGKFYTENPPEAPGILQLLNDLEKDIFDKIQIGGASWIPETAIQYSGEYLVEDRRFDDSQLELEGFAQAVKNGKPYPGLLEDAYYASICTIMGWKANREDKIIMFPEEYNLNVNS